MRRACVVLIALLAVAVVARICLPMAEKSMPSREVHAASTAAVVARVSHATNLHTGSGGPSQNRSETSPRSATHPDFVEVSQPDQRLGRQSSERMVPTRSAAPDRSAGPPYLARGP